MSSLSFRTTELFGGAMTAETPTTFIDASNVREVPDNQEVFLDRNGFTTMTIDILDRVVQFETDKEAAQYHLEDIIDGGDRIHVWSSHPVTFPRLPPGIPCIAIFATIHPGSPISSARATEPGKKAAESDFTGLFMVLVRLADQATDIVISVNVPHVSGDYNLSETNVAEGKAGPHINKGVVIRDAVIRSLEIRDWKLFAADGKGVVEGKSGRN